LAREGRQPRPPSLLDALLPIVVLIVLIATSIWLFGVAATDGPLQVALFVSAAFASLIAFKNGYTVAAIADAAVGGVTSAMGAVFILLAVGALIGTWNMAGTIPTVVHYGIGLLSPTWFYVASAAICALVGMITGSSWTTAGTLGVAFVGMANVLGLSENVAAGAVICGAYFGDKMTPLSETTILVPKLVGGGLSVAQHVRNMFWTAGPAIGISLVLFLIIGLNAEPKGAASTEAAQKALEGAFNISVLNLLPLLLLVVFSIRKFPPFLSILGAALFAGILACFTQWTAVQAFVDDPSLGPLATGAKAVYAFFSGTDAVNFVKQFDQFGLKATVKLTGAGFLTEPDVLPAQGKSALGVITGHFYTPLLDNPPPVRPYREGSWGPNAIHQLIAPHAWRLPFERAWRHPNVYGA